MSRFSLFSRLSVVSALLLPLLAGGLSAQSPERQTRIASRTMEMQGTAEQTFFYFKGEVEVQATNLDITCDELTVVAAQLGAEGQAIGEIGALQQITAAGNVRIRQAGREATAERAEVDAVKGTVVLRGNPVLRQEGAELRPDPGYMLALSRDDRTVRVVPDPDAEVPPASRSVIRLSALPNLGFAQGRETITADHLGEQVSVDPATAEGVEVDMTPPAPKAVPDVPAEETPPPPASPIETAPAAEESSPAP